MIDPTLSPHILEHPTITFRRTKSNKDQLVQSEFVGHFRSDPCKNVSIFTCGGYTICRFMNTQSDILLPNGLPFKPQHFANCKTVGVVYLLACQCGSFYIGKTKLEFHKCARRHVISILSANPELPLGRHVGCCHAGICPNFQFLILDRIHPNARGGDWIKLLLQREARWIMELNATHLPGLNTQLSYRLFLEGYE